MKRKIVVGLIAGIVSLHRAFPIIQVCETSMMPTYKDGEIIVGTRIFKRSSLKIGDVIVFHSPDSDRLVIKRIADVKKEGKDILFFCMGDNIEKSYDSRSYGYISSETVVCRILNQRRLL